MKLLFKRLYKKWLRVGDFLHEVTLAVTFLSFVPVAVFILYHLFVDFDVFRVLAGSLVFYVMVNSNIKL